MLQAEGARVRVNGKSVLLCELSELKMTIMPADVELVLCCVQEGVREMHSRIRLKPGAMIDGPRARSPRRGCASERATECIS